MNAQYIKRKIKELRSQLAEVSSDRKEYFRDIYRINRDAKLQAAKDRYHANKDEINKARRERRAANEG